MPSSNQRTVVTIGNFDGVHLGHRRLVDAAVAEAGAKGADAVAVTFEPHPVSFFKGVGAETFRLQTPDARDTTLIGLGLSRVDRLTFDETLTATTPESFVDLLKERHPGILGIHVGDDFRFGRARAGDTKLLAALGARHGFTVTVHEAVTYLDEAVSSSRVRGALRSSEMETVEALLGRPYAIAGEVAAGHGRGRTFGVPTLNLYPTGHLLPAHGVFVATIACGAQAIWAVANLGIRPTFADDPRISLEAHALTSFEELEGVVTVQLHTFLRPEKRFEDATALRAQIGLDIAAATAWHAAHPKR
jgi:riboflavin kinase/FMN adenylyltransferase